MATPTRLKRKASEMATVPTEDEGASVSDDDNRPVRSPKKRAKEEGRSFNTQLQLFIQENLQEAVSSPGVSPRTTRRSSRLTSTNLINSPSNKRITKSVLVAEPSPSRKTASPRPKASKPALVEQPTVVITPPAHPTKVL